MLLLWAQAASLTGNCVKSSVATIEAVRREGCEEKIPDFNAILVIVSPWQLVIGHQDHWVCLQWHFELVSSFQELSWRHKTVFLCYHVTGDWVPVMEKIESQGQDKKLDDSDMVTMTILWSVRHAPAPPPLIWSGGGQQPAPWGHRGDRGDSRGGGTQTGDHLLRAKSKINLKCFMSWYEQRFV